jgi:DNA invertase Pin-like site-specific DNA recombinase
VSFNDPIDTTTPVGVAIFQFCAVMAELEKGIIRERTKAGLKPNCPDARGIVRLPMA